jgi:hypothetical protein
MEKHRIIEKITGRKPIIFRPRRKPKINWEESVKKTLKVMQANHWKEQAKSKK